MTTIVAGKTNEGVVIVADKRITSGGNIINGISEFSKLIRLSESCVVGYAGDAKGMYFLRKLEIDPRSSPEEYIEALYTYMHTAFKEHNLYDEEDKAYGCRLIAAFPDHIFSIDWDGCILEHENYCAVGSGGRCAEAVLNYISNILPEDERLACGDLEDAILTASRIDIYTNAELERVVLGSIH